MSEKIELSFGLLAEPITSQLEEIGMKFEYDSDNQIAEKSRECIGILKINGFITEKDANLAYKRLMKYICKKVVAKDKGYGKKYKKGHK